MVAEFSKGCPAQTRGYTIGEQFAGSSQQGVAGAIAPGACAERAKGCIVGV
jgi:hypothetical protein